MFTLSLIVATNAETYWMAEKAARLIFEASLSHAAADPCLKLLLEFIVLFLKNKDGSIHISEVKKSH